MWKDFGKAISDFFANSGVFILRTALLTAVGVVVIKLILKAFARLLARGKVEKSARKFLFEALRYTLYLILIMVVLGSIGISITALVAVFSAAGLALSLALQGSLSNLANGIIIILNKPFKEGDNIVIGDFSGTVVEIRLLQTILKTADNKVISVPNKMVTESVILNSSALETRKMTFDFLVSYKTDIDEVKEVILKVFKGTNYVLENPKPFVALDKLETNGVRIIATCYVNTCEYSTIYYPLLEEIFNELKRNNVIFPSSQHEVLVRNDKEIKLPVRKPKELPQRKEKPQPVVKEVKIGKDIMKDYELKELESLEKKSNKKVIEPETIEEVDFYEEDNLKENEYLHYVNNNEVNVVEDENKPYFDDFYDEDEEELSLYKKAKQKFIPKKEEKPSKKIIIKKETKK